MTERVPPPLAADERAMLTSWLDYHRATLELKCAGLTDEQLRQRSVPPSSLSLLGLVRHMAEVERGWFRRGLADEHAPPSYFTDENPDGDFDDVDNADVAEAFGTWRSEYQQARELVAAAPSLDATFSGSTRQYTLRWLMFHMIEEYARHNGHADLLRERIDGSVGD
jgi:uncharacterized damage-inducible protein DinB